MKTLVTIILILACIGLVITLVVNQQKVDKERKDNAYAIQEYSNEVVAANDELNDLRQVNLALTNDLNSSRDQITDLSNQMLAMSDTISNRDSQIKADQDQIVALQTENQSLDQQASELTNTIAELTAKIAAAEQEIDLAKTNNTFVEGELNSKVQELAALQQKFNDLQAVRAQAKKLHNELVVQRRLQWIREGTQPNNGVKGGQLLMARSWPTNRLVAPSHYNMSVEVDSSGAVHIVSDTNAPATNSTPQ
jgi:uncharacterized protein YoxC